MLEFREQEQEERVELPRRRVPPLTPERAEPSLARESEHASAPPTPAARRPRPNLWRTLVTENPILHKELKAQSASSRQTAAQKRTSRLARISVVVVLYSAVLMIMRGVLRELPPEDHLAVWNVAFDLLLGLQMLCLMITSLMRLPMSIAREREKQTWNALLLSSLTPAQLLAGKLLAGMAPSFGIWLFFLPLTILAAVLSRLSAGQFLLPNLVLMATTGLLSLVALWSSFKNATTQKANNGASTWIMALFLGPLCVWGIGYVLVFVYNYFTGNPVAQMNELLRWLLFLPFWINPGIALFDAMHRIDGPGFGFFSPVIQATLPWVYITFASFTSAALWRKMLRTFRDAPTDFTG